MTGWWIVALLIVVVLLCLVGEIGIDRSYQRFKITAYCSCRKCNGNNDGITKTGKHLADGICAVDPNVIPLGSVVFIKGLGIFRAEDTGKGVVGHHIDIFVPKHYIAEEFGVQSRKVMWLKSGGSREMPMGNRKRRVSVSRNLALNV